MACACCENVGPTPCCSGGLPATIHLTISGSTACGMDGTYAMTYLASSSDPEFVGAGWYYIPPGGGSFPALVARFLCNGVNACGHTLAVFDRVTGPPSIFDTVCYQVSGCGSTSGTWSTASCSTPQWVSNPTTYLSGTCGCVGGSTTFTVGP